MRTPRSLVHHNSGLQLSALSNKYKASTMDVGAQRKMFRVEARTSKIELASQSF